MGKKSFVTRLTLIDPVSIRAIENCQSNRKGSQLIVEALYNFVRMPEGQKAVKMYSGEKIFTDS
jgi:hypothetical protein